MVTEEAHRDGRGPSTLGGTYNTYPEGQTDRQAHTHRRAEMEGDDCIASERGFGWLATMAGRHGGGIDDTHKQRRERGGRRDAPGSLEALPNETLSGVGEGQRGCVSRRDSGDGDTHKTRGGCGRRVVSMACPYFAGHDDLVTMSTSCLRAFPRLSRPELSLLVASSPGLGSRAHGNLIQRSQASPDVAGAVFLVRPDPHGRYPGAIVRASGIIRGDAVEGNGRERFPKCFSARCCGICRSSCMDRTGMGL